MPFFSSGLPFLIKNRIREVDIDLNFRYIAEITTTLFEAFRLDLLKPGAHG
jgi:hypothetical protein